MARQESSNNSIFSQAPDHPIVRVVARPTQIGRALGEMDIEWIAAHSPQAKGRIERFFGTAQDRLVKGLRKVRARTLEEANAYLGEDLFAPVEPTLHLRAKPGMRIVRWMRRQI